MNGDSELLQSSRRRRDGRDPERTSPPRRARRRRQSTPWLERNALSVIAVCMLLAVLGLGFGLLQMLNRPEPAPALLSLGQAEPAAAAATASGSIGTNGGASSASLVSAGLVPSVQVVAPAAVGSAPGEATRAIQTSAKVLQANYTIAAGDTLVQIALRFNTTVDRIQAFNNLADPRALRIGTRLVIPPPL